MRRAEGRSPTEIRNATVLLVDDDRFVRKATADYLEDAGFRIVQAGSADEAIKILTETAHYRVDVVLSDVRMPGTANGFGLARWVRSNRPGLPIMLWSGDARPVDLVKEQCIGVELMPKPSSFRLVADRLAALAGRQDFKRAAGDS